MPWPFEPVTREVVPELVGGSVAVLAVVAPSILLGYGPFRTLETASLALVEPQVAPWVWWALLGNALVGVALGRGIHRDRLVAPVLVVAILYGVVVWHLWLRVQARTVLLPGTAFDAFVLAWPLTLGLILGIGSLERR